MYETYEMAIRIGTIRKEIEVSGNRFIFGGKGFRAAIICRINVSELNHSKSSSLDKLELKCDPIFQKLNSHG